jgi:hypothetical protein
MNFPAATKKTAFFAGMSLSVITLLLDILESRDFISRNADNREIFPFIAIYFFVTMLVFVIGIHNVAPKELKTKIPFVYFPTNREGLYFYFRGWGRMLMWFFGAVIGGLLLLPLK